MFRLSEVVVPGAKRVCVVGDLNKWDTSANPMQKRKNGDSSIAFNLELDWAMLMSHYKDYSYVFSF